MLQHFTRDDGRGAAEQGRGRESGFRVWGLETHESTNESTKLVAASGSTADKASRTQSPLQHWVTICTCSGNRSHAASCIAPCCVHQRV